LPCNPPEPVLSILVVYRGQSPLSLGKLDLVPLWFHSGALVVPMYGSHVFTFLQGSEATSGGTTKWFRWFQVSLNKKRENNLLFLNFRIVSDAGAETA